MRNMLNSIIFGLVLIVFVSCVSLTDRQIPPREVETTEIIGKVQATYFSQRPFHFPRPRRIRNRAYVVLLEKAKEEYGENVDIRNIEMKGSYSPINIIPILFGVASGVLLGIGASLKPVVRERYIGSAFDYESNSWVQNYETYEEANPGSLGFYIAAGIGGGATLLIGHNQKITATGDVIVSYDTPVVTPVPASPAIQQNRPVINTARIEAAVNRASRTLIEDLPAGSEIAVINISSNNRDLSALVMDELEYSLVSARRFAIVDRRTLDTIRSEQNLQMSGEISDASAVSIGQLLGASIVITGSITETGAAQRLSLRVIDVQTAQIINMVRETF